MILLSITKTALVLILIICECTTSCGLKCGCRKTGIACTTHHLYSREDCWNSQTPIDKICLNRRKEVNKHILIFLNEDRLYKIIGLDRNDRIFHSSVAF